MNAATSLKEYMEIPMKELVESSTNPRKLFDEGALDELAASIRTKGVLSPLLVRRINGHFEIVTGARRYRAAQRAGLEEIPVRVGAFTDAEALEIQIIENIQRADVHPFQEAQGFRAFVTKGKQVFVEGRLQTRRFEDREGSPKIVTEVVVASLRVLGGAANASGSVNGQGAAASDTTDAVSETVPF
jgi:hypothetical protein